VARCQCNDQIAVVEDEDVQIRDEAAAGDTPKRGDGAFDLGSVVNGRCNRFRSERRGSGLERTQEI